MPAYQLPVIRLHRILRHWLILFLGDEALACSSRSARVQGVPTLRNDAPEWYRLAVEESRQALGTRCWERAPLGILGTEDPLFLDCNREATLVAAVAINEIYQSALERCIDDGRRGSRDGCCFAKQSSTMNELVQRCNDECSVHVGAHIHTLPSATCRTQVVGPSEAANARSRAYTPAVDAVVHNCLRLGPVPETIVAMCVELPTSIERKYCSATCESEHLRWVWLHRGGVKWCDFARLAELT
jgi:hypothetical protein